ncbi:hypothetical protein NEOC95_001793 [Neochlamydia sp. AcF95]|nr:hypothetical protein [Neochlamydia sp. AcF95]
MIEDLTIFKVKVELRVIGLNLPICHPCMWQSKQAL